MRSTIEEYVSKNTSLAAGEIKISAEKCTTSYASAMIHPLKPVTDDATVYLQKEGLHWEVLSLGTAFDAEFLSSIPKEIRQP